MNDMELKDIFKKFHGIQKDLLQAKSWKLYKEQFKKFSDWSFKKSVNTSNVSVPENTLHQHFLDIVFMILKML